MLKLDAFKLKWIAIIGMILNHMVFAWYGFLPGWSLYVLYAAGGVTFPILAYFVVEGYKHTSNLFRYIMRLLIFAVISVPFHMIIFGGLGLNILFTIILCLLSLLLYDKIKIRVLFWLIFVVLNIITAIFMFDWMIIGPIVVILYYLIRNENTRRIVPPIVAGVLWLSLSLFTIWGVSIGTVVLDATGPDYAMVVTGFGAMEVLMASPAFIIGCIAAAFLLKGFNGERGKRMKWLFYVIYPLHLAFLAGVALAMGLTDLSRFGL